MIRAQVILLKRLSKATNNEAERAHNPGIDTAISNAVEFDGLFQQLGYNAGDSSWQTPSDEDSMDPGYQLLTDDEIVSEVLDKRDVESEEEEESDEHEYESKVSHSQACEAFDIALRWLETLPNINPLHLLLVENWRDVAAHKRGDSLKQRTISSYFTH